MPDFSDNLKPAYDGTQILEAERNGSPISVEELSKHLLSRNDWLNRQARILAILEKEPLMSKKNLLNLSRPVGWQVRWHHDRSLTLCRIGIISG